MSVDMLVCVSVNVCQCVSVGVSVGVSVSGWLAPPLSCMCVSQSQ